jgi:hypothetical protein
MKALLYAGCTCCGCATLGCIAGYRRLCLCGGATLSGSDESDPDSDSDNDRDGSGNN